MRRSVQPNIPNAMTCCFFDSFKTLLMPTEPTRSVAINVSKRLLPLAGFQVIIIGRFWVITEEIRRLGQHEDFVIFRFESIQGYSGTLALDHMLDCYQEAFNSPLTSHTRAMLNRQFS